MALIADFVSGQNNVSYTRMRQLLMESGGGLQEGVINPLDFKVGPRGAGANMSVDVATGGAWVQVDTGTRNGLSHIYNDGVANLTVTSANATNPRVDYVVLRYNDTAIPAGSGGNLPTLEVLPGTSTAGAQATGPVGAGYLTGAPALPNDALLLAAFTVPAAATSIVAANIADRRKWARGAYFRSLRTGGNVTRAANTLALIDSVNMQPRIECAGNVLRCALDVDWQAATVGKLVQFDIMLDGGGVGFARSDTAAVANSTQRSPVVWELLPTSGSHFIGPGFLSADNVTTIALLAGATTPMAFTIEEIVRPSASNT